MEGYIKPRWMLTFTDLVRPGGIAAMFAVITVLPLIFAILEIGIEGVGIRLAGVVAGFFKAVPDIFYTTLQVIFLGYIAGKSGEKISSNMAAGKAASQPDTNIPNAKNVHIDQREAEG